ESCLDELIGARPLSFRESCLPPPEKWADARARRSKFDGAASRDGGKTRYGRRTVSRRQPTDLADPSRSSPAVPLTGFETRGLALGVACRCVWMLPVLHA